MKKGNLLLCLLVFLTSFSFAQPGNKGKERKEKVKALKVAFFNEKLELTETEKSKFWPIYDEVSEKLIKIKKENNRIAQQMQHKISELAENEVKQKVEKLLDNEAREIQLRKEYFQKVAEQIGYKKAAQVLHLEKEFKKELLKELQKRKNVK